VILGGPSDGSTSDTRWRRNANDQGRQGRAVLAADELRWAPWRRRPDRSGILTDFDGTLAPVVDDPQGATPLPGAVETLARLAGRQALVAVVSGRPVTFLQRHLAAVPGVLLVGLYGLEQALGTQVRTHPEAEAWASVVSELAAAATRDAPAGVGVEDKRLTLTLHTRRAPARAGWVRDWAEQQAAETGLVVHPGRQSVELRPPLAVDKGTVVRELAADLDAVCFLGDDAGDLAAFSSLRELRHAGRHTVAVAARSDESPAALLEGADVVVDGPAGVLALLRELA
jgi:trehalose 6-phosphate phosphatase